MRRAIFLPTNSITPRFKWIRSHPQKEPEYADVEEDEDDNPVISDLGIPMFDSNKTPTVIVDLENLLGDGEWASRYELVQGKQGSGEHLDHNINIARRDDFKHDGSVVNKCLSYLTKGRSDKKWKGPLMLYGMTKVCDSRYALDLTVSDLTVAIEAVVEPRKKPKTTGVIVNSFKPLFQTVDVPLQHPVFSEGQQSEFSNTFDVPLKTYRSLTMLRKQSPSDVRIPAVWLHAIVNAHDSYSTDVADIGTVPQGWIGNSRSILVVQADKEPVTTEFVAGACVSARSRAMRLATNQTS